MNRSVADYSLTSNTLRYSDMECLDPRDRVYGLLGISALGSRPTVDYEKTLTEIYIDVMTPEIEWSMEITLQFLTIPEWDTRACSVCMLCGGLCDADTHTERIVGILRDIVHGLHT